MPDSKWSADQVLEHLTALRDADIKRYDAQFDAQKRETDKKDEALKAEFEGVNKIRGSLDDLSRLMILRTEATAKFDAATAANKATDSQLTARLDQVEKRLNVGDGSVVGVKSVRDETRLLNSNIIGWVIAAIAIAVAYFNKGH